MRVRFRFSYLFVLFFVFSTGFSDQARALTLLRPYFDQEIHQTHQDFPPALLRHLKGHHIVFVDGIMNELASILNNYFTDSIGEVENLGLTHSHLRLSSRTSVSENGDLLFVKVSDIIQKEQKPLVLIGHSMGGALIMNMILKHPELLLFNEVERVVLFAPAIGGSILAESFAEGWIAWGLKTYLGEGLKSLSTERAQDSFRAAFEYFQDRLESHFGSREQERYQAEFERVSSKVFYVRFQHNPKEPLSLGLKIVLAFMKKGLDPADPNDGLLTLEDQILKSHPEFGIDLGVLEADHIELVVAGRISRSDQSRRQAFTRAVLRSICQADSSGTGFDTDISAVLLGHGVLGSHALHEGI